MKKTLSVILASAFAVSAFSQGFVFQTTKAQGAYFSPSSGAYALGNNTITVGFEWAAASTASAIGAGSSTNYSGAALAPSTWTTLLTDPNFNFATNAGSLVTVAVNNSGVTQAGWNYQSAAAFVPLGTTAGNTYSVFAVAWNSTYATPWLAAAGNSFVGWSSVIQYASSPSSSQAPPTFAASGLPAFGIIPVATPEPATMALFALGGASVLLFRRRK
jgi:hypothetical protein